MGTKCHLIYLQNYSLVQQWINWQQQKDATKQRTCNHTTITQLARCKVEIENNDKCKIYIFLVVPGNREVLLGMPYIKLLNIFNINCNRIGTDKEEKTQIAT